MDMEWIQKFTTLVGRYFSWPVKARPQETVRRAIRKILTGLKDGNFNSLEITRVASGNFLGVPYTRVSFHSRNLQEGMFLSGSGNFPAGKDTNLVAA